MFLHRNFLNPQIVLEHFAEMDRCCLANGVVRRIIHIYDFKSIVRTVKDGENSDDPIVINVIVSQIQL